MIPDDEVADPRVVGKGHGEARWSSQGALLAFFRRSNPGLDFQIVINKYQRRSKSQAAHILSLAQAAGPLGARILEPHLTLRVAVQDALAGGVPVWAFRSADRRLRADWQRLSETLLGIA